MIETEKEPKIIDPEIKAELVDLCVATALELMHTKDRTLLDGETHAHAYDLWLVTLDLVDTNPELGARLAETFDPDVNYSEAEEASHGFEGTVSPQQFLLDVQKAIACDVAFAYAWTSQEVKDLEAERSALAGVINP